jgi:peptidyl-prolyl cis-trans isomerase A (cyclophilin A)
VVPPPAQPITPGVVPPPTQPPGVPPTQPAAVETTPHAGLPAGPSPRVALEIGRGDESWGEIVLELDLARAPQTVTNFLQYVNQGFYNGTIIHRISPNFLIQAGGYTTLTELKKAGLHEPITNESRGGLKNKRLSVALARPHKNAQGGTSQFFINLEDNPKLDPPDDASFGYAVFGRVISGEDVIQRLRQVETRPNPQFLNEKSQPLDPPVIRSARRIAPGAGLPAAGPDVPGPPPNVSALDAVPAGGAPQAPAGVEKAAPPPPPRPATVPGQGPNDARQARSIRPTTTPAVAPARPASPQPTDTPPPSPS